MVISGVLVGVFIDLQPGVLRNSMAVTAIGRVTGLTNQIVGTN